MIRYLLFVVPDKIDVVPILSYCRLCYAESSNGIVRQFTYLKHSRQICRPVDVFR
jgi:hypothetical protein